MRTGGTTIILPALALLIAVACGGGDNSAVDRYSNIGEPCTSDNRCAGDLICAHDGTCQEERERLDEDGYGDAEEGEDCAHTDDCGYGLVCGPDRVCIPGGIADTGEGCGSSEDCRYGLVCDETYHCSAPGDGGIGATCRSDADCNPEYVCGGNGTCQDPSTGTGVGGPGDGCITTEDCRMGLVCFGLGLEESVCTAPEIWRGADCSDSVTNEDDPSTPFKAYFEIPRGTAITEFYRLPFPNNIRFRGGHIDLSGHPVPDTPMASGLVASYLDAIENEATGFSVQGAIFFRFSKRVDFDTIRLAGDNKNFFLADITPDSPAYGSGGAISMYATTARGKYICQNWVSLKPSDGWPLRHSTTYAVIVTDGIHSAEGVAPVPDDDFAAMLSDTAPSDATLEAAWDEFQPLRDFLADDIVADPDLIDTVMAATVFTTMDPDALMEPFRDKIRDCTGSDCSDLPDPAPVGLAYDTEDVDYYQLTGSVSVPVFQDGTPPYVADGGIINFSSSGNPTIQRNEPVDFTLTIPKGTPPAEGWPVVIFAHDTGGDSSSFVDEGVAETLASVEVTVDTTTETVQFAVLSIDAVQHESRRGGSDMGPDILYFNFLNPEAAKYNGVQGAADNFQLVRMIESLHDTPITVSGVDDPVQLDSASIHYFGHTQGCLTGPLFLAYTPAVQSVVLSGAGGNFIQTLLTKTQPFDVAGMTRLILGDPYVGTMHPMLNLMQLYFDPVDVINYGRDMTYSPRQIDEIPGDPPTPVYAGPMNVFMSFGRDDRYSTEKTMLSFMKPMGLQQVNDLGITCNCNDSDCDSIDSSGLHENLCLAGIGEATTPVRGNGVWSGIQFTAVMKMYLPDGYDGHSALFEHDNGPADYSLFLASTVADVDGISTFFP